MKFRLMCDRRIYQEVCVLIATLNDDVGENVLAKMEDLRDNTMQDLGSCYSAIKFD